MPLDDERLAGLARTKLRTLVRGRWPEVTAEPESFAAGVGIADAGRAFVYLTGPSPSPLAAVLAWGASRGATELHVVVDSDDPVLALAVGGLAPAPTVWRAVGTALERLAPTPDVAVGAAPPTEALALVPLIGAAGADVVIEHGVVVGEVLGLEVARIVTDGAGGAELRVGVGLYDQEAHALMNAVTAVPDRLVAVVAEVRAHRARTAGPHPLNRVARERWLRALVLADPGRLGLDHAEPLEPLVRRGGIHEGRPVAALGHRGGERVLVVSSAGIDLDLVPHAAGHLARVGADRVVLVLPERDHHRVIHRQAAHLAAPWELAGLPEPWP